MKVADLLCKTFYIAIIAIFLTTPLTAKSKKTKVNEVLNRGQGLRITVITPTFNDENEETSWLPEFVQSMMTSGLHDYSSMTVTDRMNENLAISERKRAENLTYNEDGAMEMGKITQAQYILATTIINAGGVYTISMRINDGTTNEIKATLKTKKALL